MNPGCVKRAGSDKGGGLTGIRARRILLTNALVRALPAIPPHAAIPDMDHSERARETTRVAAISVASNSMLVVLKLVVGLMIGSVAVISEAIHSGMDLVAAIIALYAVKTASQPADEDHPYGHGKAENISGTIEALLIFLAAGWIIWEAGRKLMGQHQVQMLGWGVAVMALSTVVNIIVSEMLFRTARRTDSIALEADAWHLRTDVYTSAGVMAALGFIALTETHFTALHAHWVDPVAGIVVAMLIIQAAWHLTMSSARDLMDAALPEDEARAIEAVLQNSVEGVEGYHKLRTRKAGSQRFVDVHVLVDPLMTVARAHEVAYAVEDAITRCLPRTAVVVHIEPCEEEAKGEDPEPEEILDTRETTARSA